MSTAHLSDPDVIREFRRRLAGFLHVSAGAIESSTGDLARVKDWLAGEQMLYWKQHVRKREELYHQAHQVWMYAEGEVKAHHGGQRGSIGKASSIEERVLMDKARRSLEEAREKLALLNRWLIRIDRECTPLAHACSNQHQAMREQGARALLHLDQLADHVQDYLDISPKIRPSTANIQPAENTGGDEPCRS